MEQVDRALRALQSEYLAVDFTVALLVRKVLKAYANARVGPHVSWF